MWFIYRVYHLTVRPASRLTRSAAHSVVPAHVIAMMAARLETPTADEPAAFDELCELPFVPGPFDNAEQERRFFLFLGA